MTTDEKRFLRREQINRLLHAGFDKMSFIVYLVRNYEKYTLKQSLNIYSTEG